MGRPVAYINHDPIMWTEPTSIGQVFFLRYWLRVYGVMALRTLYRAADSSAEEAPSESAQPGGFRQRAIPVLFMASALPRRA